MASSWHHVISYISVLQRLKGHEAGGRGWLEEDLAGCLYMTDRRQSFHLPPYNHLLLCDRGSNLRSCDNIYCHKTGEKSFQFRFRKWMTRFFFFNCPLGLHERSCRCFRLCKTNVRRYCRNVSPTTQARAAIWALQLGGSMGSLPCDCGKDTLKEIIVFTWCDMEILKAFLFMELDELDKSVEHSGLPLHAV